mmetsp:Transcript_74652/g.139372  ORF Transcript_74652/g.139372 Transcript_74652/m.139372 type:complete len:391 (+) Transcript_74652:83-1255(+)
MVSVAQGPGQVDRAALAARIQGFGNVNPPPLPEDNASTVAKRAVGNLGDMLGEEVMLTVQDFKEKGAVGAVKDAVADAGDILIDGVSSIFGWVRGDPPEEEESAAADDAAKVLSQGPRGAAYGVSQASPTGGINAVWVMPEDADPSTMAQLMAEQRQEQQKAMPPGIQPYVAPGSRAQVPMPGMPPQAPMVLPGGQTIAPYQPSGPGVRMPPFVPNAPGAPGFQGSMPSMAAGGVSSTKTMVEQISKGQIIPGPESAKRLVSQCSATKVTPSQLGDAICERIRRLYLGLDGSVDADVGILCLLTLADALHSEESRFAKEAAVKVKEGVPEELLSLRSSVANKSKAEPMLTRLGLVQPAQEVNLLGDLSAEADLLGNSAGAAPAAEVNLLG